MERERLELWSFEGHDEVKIKDQMSGRWAWFAPDGSVTRRGTATIDEINRWSRKFPISTDSQRADRSGLSP